MFFGNRTYFVVTALLFTLTNATAQFVRPLQQLKGDYQTAAAAKTLSVQAFARQQNIPLFINTNEGRHMLLVDFEDGIPIYLSGLNSEAATTTGASNIRGGMNGLNIEGEGILIGVWDEGSVVDHIELGARVVTKEVADEKTHASHVTGTIIASGVNPLAKGMAPKGKVTNWYFDNDLAEMAALAKPDETSLLLSNHSYGTVTGWTKINGNWSWSGNSSISNDEDYRFGFYGAKASQLDKLANLAPYYTIVWAAGNDRGEPGDGSRPPDCNGGTGYDCIIPESVAKNIITVGAINKAITYSGPSSLVMSSFSSWGPTDDGRIKPDLVGAGVDLFSLSADGVNAYGFLSGTSMATPNVTGSLALLQDLYSQLHGGAFMKSATLKALAIHTAREAGLLPGPDYSFGWGLLEVESAAKLLLNEDGINNIVREGNLKNGSTFEMTLNPKANQKITVTIVWNDPAAQPVTASLDPINLMLVNDLDVKLIAEGGTTSYPWLLDPSTPNAQAIRGENYRDNVEKLEFNLPVAKPYKLLVSHKGVLVNDSQDFSLIVTYKSTQSIGNTLYWIGDTGNWEDNAHWSLTSGGASALMIPGPADRVIVDENSFDGIGIDEIKIGQNQTCASVKWMRSLDAKLNLQEKTLTVGKEFTVSNSHFGISGNGIIRCANSVGSKGNLFFSNADFGDVQLIIDGGDWTMKGDLTAAHLEMQKGNLLADRSDLRLNNLIANSLVAKKLTLNKSTIEIIDQSDIDGVHLELEMAQSKIHFNNTTASLNWSMVNLNGIMEVIKSTISINGNNTIDTLNVGPGSSIILAGGTNQNIDWVESIGGEPESVVTVSSPSNASITLTSHFLVCTDYLHVNNVDLIGSARINTGPNGLITNSKNWLAQACESVLFADFDEKYLCQNGFTEFFDKSSNATSWEWQFGDEASANNVSGLQNPFHSFFEPGPYTVQLTASDGKSTHSYSKEIEIVPSSFDRNAIAVNDDQLMSVAVALSYQWFFNEQKIDDAVFRSYNYEGKDGVYRVVINGNEVCNIASGLVTITGFEEVDNGLQIFPNPANGELNVISNDTSSGKVVLSDLLGRPLMEAQLLNNLVIPLHQLQGGIFLLKVTRNGKETIKKILVRHQ